MSGYGGGGGGWVPVGAVTAAGGTVDFVGLAADHDYMVTLQGVTLSVDTADLQLVLGTGATPTYVTANYRNAYADSHLTADNTFSGGAAAAAFLVANNVKSGNSINADVIVIGPGDNATVCAMLARGQFYDNGGSTVRFSSDGHQLASAVHTAIRFLASSGNISGGRFKLYKRKRAS